MKAFIIILGIVGIVLICQTCLAGKKKAEPAPQKPAFVASIEKIARGTTMQSQDAKNVSFTLTPVRAFITISF
ncbi:MAG: hypothetical protein WC956_01790 [bacterium]